MIAALILAAGESRRMGSPKALIPYHGLTFVEHLLAATRHARIGITRVVLGAGAEGIRARLPVKESQIVVNEEWERGPLSSIQAGLRSLPDGDIEAALICPVDHPLVTLRLVGAIVGAFDRSGKAIVLPVYLGRRGHPVLFARRLFADLMNAPMDVGARAVVHAHRGEIEELPTEEEGVVLNLNDPGALSRLR
jgi:CTP:molybdopterin cytidylyltransferase MocA